jgi:hypothetical protein
MSLKLTSLLEGMSDEEFADAQAFDRLSKDDQDKLSLIKQMMAKEKRGAAIEKNLKENEDNSPYIDEIKRDLEELDDKEANEYLEDLSKAILKLKKLSKMEEDLFSKDGGSEDNVDNIDKVASPSAKANDYSSAVSSNRSEDSAEQAGTTKTTKPMYTENKVLSLMDLAKKLGIDVDELEAKVAKFKGKEKDEIEASAKASMAEENDEKKLPMDEVRVDREVAERIEGLVSIPLKRKFLDSFMDLYQDLIEEDPFYAEDVIDHLNNEMHKELDGWQSAGDRLAGIEIEENGDVKDYSEELSEGAYKDFIMQAKETYSQSEVEAYIDSLNNDIRLNGGDQYDDFDVEDYLEDLRNYIDDKMGDVREHFSRFK